MNFASKLQIGMRRLGIERDELMARVAEMGQTLGKSTMTNYLDGKTRPNMMLGLALARVLGVPLDYLADDSIEEVPRPQGDLSPDERAVLALYRVHAEAEKGRLTPEELGRRILKGSHRETGEVIPGVIFDPENPGVGKGSGMEMAKQEPAATE